MQPTATKNSGVTPEGYADFGVLNQFRGDIRPPPTSMLYNAGLAVVAVAMVLLPLVYLFLIGLVGWGVYYHATHHFGSIMHLGLGRSGRGTILLFLVYGAPIVAGVILVFFMIKPLFAGRPPKAEPYALNKEAEPLLHAFIHRICALVGSPTPKRIDLDCQLNASASFRRGFGSMFSDDLVLTIGLPLVAGLNAQQLAGVLAHEFGHFSQGAGMRLTYLIRSINLWFARVVYERDAWDVYLVEVAENLDDWRISILMNLSRLGVWLSRQILWLLMLAGNLISSFMLRQMERDADAWEIRLVGSETFESTFIRLQHLGAALETSYKEMRVGWNLNRHLPDNLSHFLINKFQEMPVEVLQRTAHKMASHKTGLMDTHPSDAERIECARNAKEPGVFQCELPATSLFQNFEVPARFVTVLHYQDDLGLEITPAALMPTDLKQSPPSTHAPVQSATPKSIKSAKVQIDLDRYFYGLLPIMSPLTLSSGDLASPLKIKDPLHTIRTFDRRMEEVLPQVEAVVERFAHARKRRLEIRKALNLLDAGVALEPSLYGLTDSSIANARSAESSALEEENRMRQKLDGIIPEVKGRFAAALCLLQAPNLANWVPEAAQLKQEAELLIEFLNKAASWHGAGEELAMETACLKSMIEYQKSNAATVLLTTKIHQKAAAITQQLATLGNITMAVSYPLAHPDGAISVHDFVVERRVDNSVPSAVFDETRLRLERLTTLYVDVLKRLIEIGHSVESRF